MAVTGSKAEILPGETAQYTLDLTNINGTRFLLQVYDYAMNTTTYVIDQQIGDPTALPAMIGFNVLRPVSYTHLDVYKRQPQRSGNICIISCLPHWQVV